jgi:hypothetical protein
MVQRKNVMMQCRQLLVDCARMRYTGKQHRDELLKMVDHQGFECEEFR